MVRVSVVTPCYNAARFIAAAVESIRAQTLGDWEMLVVDDGSTDGSPEIVAAIGDARVRVLRQANRGPSAARNAGVRETRGAYVAFLDADDIALPDRLAAQAAVLDGEPDLAVVASGYQWIDACGRVLPAEHSWQYPFELNALRDWLFDCPLVPSATMIRRSAWAEVGGFEEKLRGGEDWHFWMRLVLSGHRMAWLRQVVCHYRRLPTGLASDGARMARDCTEVLHEIISRADFPAGLSEAARQGLALRHVDGAKREFSAGLWRAGRADLAEAIELDAALLAGRPCRIESELLNAALDPLTPEPLAFLATALAHLPDSASWLRERHDETLHLYYVAQAGRSLRARAYRRSAEHAVLAIAQDPAAFGGRHAWRRFARSLLGRARARATRTARRGDRRPISAAHV